MLRVAMCFVLLISAGCVTAPREAACEWREEPAVALTLTTAAERRHLNADMRTAEEIAIRFADRTRGRRSGHYAGPEDYTSTRTHCLAALAGTIAGRHQLDPSQVADAVGQRDARLDAAVFSIVALLFVVAANSFCRELFRRFPPDEPWPAIGMAAAGAVAVTAAGLMIGGLGAMVVEMTQLGNTHLSYRTDRLPWTRHWSAIFAAGIVLFMVVAAIRWRRARSLAAGE